MRRLALTLTLALSAMFAVSQATSQPADDAYAGPRGAQVVSLQVFPERIDFDHRFARAQLLVMAELDDGSIVDLTRDASIQPAAAHVEVDDRGRVKPVSDGEGALTVRAGDVIATVPFAVSNIGAAFRPSFVRDVLPILSKIGCNTGTCHGAAQGKNGFQLSLRGYDPDFDHAALTDDLAGRRLNPVDPGRSLFLLKSTGSVPHQGGRVLDESSPEYEVLQLWVEQGAHYDAEGPRPIGIEVFPNEPTLADAGSEQQFAVIATYPDGSEVDVTQHAFVEVSDIEVLDVDDAGKVTGLRRGEAAILARYEGRYAATRVVVMGDRSGFAWKETPVWNKIDELVLQKLQRVKVLPSELCTDDEFLRRVTLDLTGRLPTVDEARIFLMDRRATRIKREELVDRLIGSADFVQYWTSKWADLLQVNSKFLGEEGAERFRRWIQESVASNQPYDTFVQDILTASGSTYENPPANYFKTLRQADLVMENTTQLFLGVRFNCNKCHDHPFERWTRDNHWQLAAAFARVERRNAPGSPIMPRIGVDARPAYEEIIEEKAEGEVIDPDTGVTVAMNFPYEHAGPVQTEAPRRDQLVAWLTAPENPYFARSYVNRVWSYFFGLGIIDPVDDIRASNPPSNPALLDHLTEGFVTNDFDARALIRQIVTSRTYQLSVETNSWNADDRVNFSHALPRRLPAEVLHDAVHQAAGVASELEKERRGTRAVALLDGSVETEDGFLGLFGRPPRETACECERTENVSLGQALSLVNGPTIAEAIRDEQNGISELVAVEDDSDAILEELYLAFLGRRPTASERDQLRPSLDPLLLENRFALAPEEEASLWSAFDQWQRETRLPVWHPVEVDSVRAAQGSEFVVQPDGSLLATGANPDKETLTVLASTGLQRVTGVRIEALPHDSLPAKGPGRAENGNFVLHEFEVHHVPLGDPATSVTTSLQHPTANFSQQGWPIGKAIDGKYDSGSGWAVSPQFGKAHEGVFELKEDLTPTASSLLVFELDQQYGTMHTLGRFRLSVTDLDRPIRHHGYSEAVAAALQVAPDDRNEAQLQVLYSHFMEKKTAEQDRIRLGATQDLAWALANSPAFPSIADRRSAALDSESETQAESEVHRPQTNVGELVMRVEITLELDVVEIEADLGPPVTEEAAQGDVELVGPLHGVPVGDPAEEEPAVAQPRLELRGQRGDQSDLGVQPEGVEVEALAAGVGPDVPVEDEPLRSQSELDVEPLEELGAPEHSRRDPLEADLAAEARDRLAIPDPGLRRVESGVRQDGDRRGLHPDSSVPRQNVGEIHLAVETVLGLVVPTPVVPGEEIRARCRRRVVAKVVLRVGRSRSEREAEALVFRPGTASEEQTQAQGPGGPGLGHRTPTDPVIVSAHPFTHRLEQGPHLRSWT